MNVNVIGGGNIGTRIAAYAAAAGCAVMVYSLFSFSLEVVDENGNLAEREVKIVAADSISDLL